MIKGENYQFYKRKPFYTAEIKIVRLNGFFCDVNEEVKIANTSRYA